MVFETLRDTLRGHLVAGRDGAAQTALELLITRVETHVATLTPEQQALWADTRTELPHILEHFPALAEPPQRTNVLTLLDSLTVL